MYLTWINLSLFTTSRNRARTERSSLYAICWQCEKASTERTPGIAWATFSWTCQKCVWDKDWDGDVITARTWRWQAEHYVIWSVILTLRTGSSYHLSCTTKQLTSGFESKDRAASDSCSHGLISHKQIISAVGNLSLVRLPPWSGAVDLSQ